VIEGAIFEHYDDHVVDLFEIGGMDPLALIDSHSSSVVGQLGNRLKPDAPTSRTDVATQHASRNPISHTAE
jgi:hypothetical protein